MLPSVNVTVIAVDPTTNQPLVGAAVSAKITAQDKYQGQIIARDTIAGVTDAAGQCVLALFPNTSGEVLDGEGQHTAYAFVVKSAAGKTVYKTVARVPAFNVNVTDIAGNTAVAVPNGAQRVAGDHDAEIPLGAIDGVNKVFTLQSTPFPAASLRLYLNGLLQTQWLDYSLNGNTIRYLGAGPQVGDAHISWYRA